MYRINVYDVETDGSLLILDDSCRRYEYHDDAKAVMMEAMINDIGIMMDISIKKEIESNAFVPCMNEQFDGKRYDGMIQLWNIPAGIYGRHFRLYEIEWVNEDDADEYNKKLKDRYGEHLTLWIREEYDEDEVEDENGIDVIELKTFYYEGVTCGKSEIFDTPEEAYNEACGYLDNIELYVDLE